MQRRPARLLLSCLLAAALVEIAVACGGGSSGGQSTSATTEGGDVARWVQQERLPRSAVPGAELFSSSGCTACHTYAGSGHANLGAPDLTAVGQRHLGIAFEIRQLACPSCVKQGSAMPSFASLGRKRLRQLAVFLEASKGTG